MEKQPMACTRWFAAASDRGCGVKKSGPCLCMHTPFSNHVMSARCRELIRYFVGVSMHQLTHTLCTLPHSSIQARGAHEMVSCKETRQPCVGTSIRTTSGRLRPQSPPLRPVFSFEELTGTLSSAASRRNNVLQFFRSACQCTR